MKILLLTHAFPNSKQLTKGIFNLSRAEVLRELGHNVTIISPICLTPPERFLFPYPKFIKIFRHIRNKLSITMKEKIDGFSVYHPRWFSLPKRFFL